MTEQSYKVTAGELRQHVEAVERIQSEQAALKEDEKERFAAAKAAGFDVKVMRKLIALRKRDKDDIAEEEAVMDMYREALGM